MLGVINNSYDNIYEKIDNIIYKKTFDKTLIKIINFTPILYNGKKFLLTSFLGLEHLFLNKNNKIFIKYFLDEKTYGDIILNKHLNLLNIKKFNVDFLEEYDSFYDEHTQILFIKFQDICIEYIDISNFNLNRLIFTSFNNQNIIISFLDNSLNKLTMDTTISSDYIYKSKYFTFHELPYLTTFCNSCIPRKGSSVMNYSNELVGIVNNIVLENKIMITPLISIIRSLKYLECNNNLLTINFDFVVETIEDIDHSHKNVLKILNNITESNKDINKKMYITSVDKYLIADDGKIIYNDNNIPLRTYIWLNMLNKINISYLKYKNNKIISKTKIIHLKKLEKISNICVSRLNYFNTKNTFIFELNEKILSIIFNYLNKYPEYKNILEKIYNNRFSIKKKKILLLVKLNKNKNHYFEIIEDYLSISDINEKLNISKSLEIKLSTKTIKLVKN